MNKNKSNPIKIGIDFGKTIGLVEEDNPYKDCYSIIKFLRKKYGKENLYIVSKARKEMKEKILAWLLKNKFFEETEMIQENLIFCDNYEDKRLIVEKLGINVFIDDHFKVIKELIKNDKMIKIIWFNSDANIKLIEKKYRLKIIITSKWNKLVKVFNNL